MQKQQSRLLPALLFLQPPRRRKEICLAQEVNGIPCLSILTAGPARMVRGLHARGGSGAIKQKAVYQNICLSCGHGLSLLLHRAIDCDLIVCNWFVMRPCVVLRLRVAEGISVGKRSIKDGLKTLLIPAEK